MAYEGEPMTEAMYYVLLSLSNPNHGYQLMTEINKLSKGRITMGPGTLYGVLTRMLKDKLIVVIEDDGRRKTYQITKEGQSALLQEYNRLKCLVEDGSLLEGGSE
jgi:DNA-binding PadR family transcriptional regulator